MAQALLIYRTGRPGKEGYFVCGESDDLFDLGGTSAISEARVFTSKKVANEVIKQLAKQASIDVADFHILKRA
ncbi:hypothetical protein BGV72_24400 [Burkholderia ubonensis]|uniref:hypothetical protein n=1 Tax=Burkholderia ubonensis TaxID=101571 RepID=UPI00075501E6|nr:hypothetical protein [Burkholderia ubonensis]KVZ57540.1 hypothetical protein WL19_03490 [Burkholderia ubonensis]OJA74498.1 hypothetical protein BGV72_24400 [Burkholderia ubonensis]